MKKLFLFVSLIALFLAMALSVSAQTIPNPASGYFIDLGSSNTFSGLIAHLITIFVQVLGLFALFFLILGGFRYMMARGDSEALESAKKTITNAIIGLVIVILSYIIIAVAVNALFGRTGAPIPSQSIPTGGFQGPGSFSPSEPDTTSPGSYVPGTPLGNEPPPGN